MGQGDAEIVHGEFTTDHMCWEQVCVGDMDEVVLSLTSSLQVSLGFA